MHTKYPHPNVINEAVEFVRDHFRLYRGLDIRPAHAHAAVSHFLGYNSKIALKSDPFFDQFDADLINYCEAGVEKLAEHIPRMQQTPLQTLGKLRTSCSSVGNGRLRDAEKPAFQSLIIG